jgi:ABC-type phosphate transport system substrate-binding protein
MRVSFPLTAEGGPIRVVLAALCTMAVLAVVAVGSPTAAHASITACENGAPTGGVETIGIQGSSLQKSAIEFWNSSKIYLSENLDAFGCGSGAGKVEYLSKSSGCGLDAMGAGIPATGCSLTALPGLAGGGYESAGYRDEKVRIGASDFPPDPEEQEKINDGPTGGQHAGKIHVLPVASAAIAVVVHFPEGCALNGPGTGTADSGVGTLNEDVSTGGVNDPTGEATGDSEGTNTLRLHIPAEGLEKIWEHQITEWGEIPTPTGGSLSTQMTGTPTGKDASDTCATAPIFRIARNDTSGTSYNFKAYLSLLPSFKEDGGTKLWKEGEVGSTNTAWPRGSATETGIPAEVPKTKGEEVKGESGSKVIGGEAEECTTTISPNQICRSNAEGGGSLAKAVKATDGSIGYLDVATARKEGFILKSGEANYLYWLPLQAVNPAVAEPSKRIEHPLVFDEPTIHPTAHFSTTLVGEKGANCEKADYRGFPSATAAEPDPTLGNWSNAIATGGGAYPVCAITYDLAFQNDATVYGSQAPEEARARTVKEYLSSVLSVRGQTELPEFDYGVLPNTKGNPLLEDAQKGVAAIEWNSTGSSGGKEEVKAPETKTTTTTTTPLVTPVVVPSNAFSIAGAKVKGKDIVLSLVLPDAGKVQIKATGGGVTVASVNSSVSGGNGTVSLAISKSALTKIEKAKGHKLSVKITVTFTPTGGTAASESKTITLTQAELASKKNKKASKGKKK